MPSRLPVSARVMRSVNSADEYPRAPRRCERSTRKTASFSSARMLLRRNIAAPDGLARIYQLIQAFELLARQAYWHAEFAQIAIRACRLERSQIGVQARRLGINAAGRICHGRES